MFDFRKKIKDARLLLGKTQNQAAEESGILQKEISKTESGLRKFIPNEYMIYLHSNNIDLNTIFDEFSDVAFRNTETDATLPGNAIEKISNLSIRLGEQIKENEHLHKANMTLDAENRKLKDEILELKSQKKAHAPHKSYSMVAEPELELKNKK